MEISRTENSADIESIIEKLLKNIGRSMTPYSIKNKSFKVLLVFSLKTSSWKAHWKPLYQNANH